MLFPLELPLRKPGKTRFPFLIFAFRMLASADSYSPFLLGSPMLLTRLFEAYVPSIPQYLRSLSVLFITSTFQEVEDFSLVGGSYR